MPVTRQAIRYESKKDLYYNEQTKEEKHTNNDLQNNS